MNESWVTSVAVAPMHVRPDYSSEMVSQSLFWEEINFIQKKDNWNFIRSMDGYEAWMHSSYMLKTSICRDREIMISNRYMPVYSKKNTLKSIKAVLSFGTKIPIINEDDDYFEIIFPDETRAFMVKNTHNEIKCRDNLISLSKSLLGVPYLWGGSSSFGYDCSGYVQSVLKSLNISIARDSNCQQKDERLFKVKEMHSGNLIFFLEDGKVNHVGFVVDENRIIHCSGEVKIESLMFNDNNFNKELFEKDHLIMSVNNLLKNQC